MLPRPSALQAAGWSGGAKTLPQNWSETCDLLGDVHVIGGHFHQFFGLGNQIVKILVLPNMEAYFLVLLLLISGSADARLGHKWGKASMDRKTAVPYIVAERANEHTDERSVASVRTDIHPDVDTEGNQIPSSNTHRTRSHWKKFKVMVKYFRFECSWVIM